MKLREEKTSRKHFQADKKSEAKPSDRTLPIHQTSTKEQKELCARTRMAYKGTPRLVLGLCVLWALCALSVRGEEKTIDSCANRQQQNATFNEAGENTLHIRKLADILQFACTVQVKSQNADQINTVVVHGDDVDMTLTWLFNDKSLTIESRAGKTLQIVSAKVDRFVLEIGGTRNTVQFVAGALATETVLRFPATALNATVFHSLRQKHY